MNTSDTTSVILVGFVKSSITAPLRRMLADQGFFVKNCDTADDAVRLLAEGSRATLVVYVRDSPDVDHILEQASRQGSPAVVIVDHAEFGQYYSLMNQGAIGYFEADEPLSLILGAISQAGKRAGTV